MSETTQDSSATPWLDQVLKAAVHVWSIYRGTVRGKISLALVAGGVALIGGNWIEAVASAAWEMAFDNSITFPAVSPVYGLTLVVLGIGFYGWTARDERSAAAAVVRPTVAMIRHESMEGLTQPLQGSALPAELKSADTRLYEIDQSPFYESGIVTASGAASAVRMQTDLVPGIRGVLANKPDSEIVYYGKAHVPLVFLAGHSLSTGWPVRLYELDRQKGDWWPIDEGDVGEDLGLLLERSDESDDSRDVVIRVSISYPVDVSDVTEALRRPYRDVHITIAGPHVDAVRTQHQVEAIAGMFREVLDGLKRETPAPERIHVFYSGPMSVAFCLGRQISPTVHPPIFVYNFTAKTIPKYAWALHVNGQGSAESLIVSTLAEAA